MKQKLFALSKVFLTTCMAFSLWFGSDFPSIVIFGEYPYPTEDEN